MPRFHAQAATVYKDEIDITGISNGVTINIDNVLGDVTAFADTDMTYVEGTPRFTIDYSGIYSKASPNFDAEIFADLTSVERAVGVYEQGITAGNLGWEGKTNVSRAPYTARTNSAILLDVSWTGSDPIVPTIVHHYDATFDATHTPDPQQVGAVSATQKFVCVVRAFSTSGTSETLNIVLQSDNGVGFDTPTTRHTFTEITSSATHQIAEVSGAITDDYWRCTLTLGGSSPSYDLLVTMGITDLT